MACRLPSYKPQATSWAAPSLKLEACNLQLATHSVGRKQPPEPVRQHERDEQRVAQEQGERAIKLMSAAEALRGASDSPRTPQEKIEYERELASLRGGMDEDTFERLWTEAQGMSMDQAIDLAMAEDDE